MPIGDLNKDGIVNDSDYDVMFNAVSIGTEDSLMI